MYALDSACIMNTAYSVIIVIVHASLMCIGLTMLVS